jgi:hypothetical protein
MALGVVGALGLLGAPGRAVAQDRDPTSDAAVRAGAQAWFREYIEPGLRTLAANEQSEALTVPLEPPGEHPGVPGRLPIHRLGALGPLGMLVLDVDVPQQRGNWSDPLQPQMFRFYLEPIPAPKTPSPMLPGGRAAGA